MTYSPIKLAAFVVAVAIFTIAAQDPHGPLADVVTWAGAWLMFAVIVVGCLRLAGWVARNTLR